MQLQCLHESQKLLIEYSQLCLLTLHLLLLFVHRHIRSIDFPRAPSGDIDAIIHPARQGSNWIPIENGEPLFIKADGTILRYEGDESLIPVFINEAAYAEKNIAMSLTKREIWDFSKDWQISINKIFHC